MQNSDMMAVRKFSVGVGLIAVTDQALELGTSNLRQILIFKMSSYRVLNIIRKSEATNVAIVCKSEGLSET
jgi:hypothetical protein